VTAAITAASFKPLR
jgi:hypothetical protein